jgi:hypothetical protein
MAEHAAPLECHDPRPSTRLVARSDSSQFDTTLTRIDYNLGKVQSPHQSIVNTNFRRMLPAYNSYTLNQRPLILSDLRRAVRFGSDSRTSGMSALSLLYPRKRTLIGSSCTSALCHKQTVANFIEKASRLYEQKRSAVSAATALEMYVRRWLWWSHEGLKSQPFDPSAVGEISTTCHPSGTLAHAL